MNQFPWLLWGLPAGSLPQFVPPGRQSICWVSVDLLALRWFSISMLSPSPFPSYAHIGHKSGTVCTLRTSVLASAQERAFFPPLGLSLRTSSPSSLEWSLILGVRGGTRSLPCDHIFELWKVTSSLNQFCPVAFLGKIFIHIHTDMLLVQQAEIEKYPPLICGFLSVQE